MRNKTVVALLVLALSGAASSQRRPRPPTEDQPIRISADLIQLDVVVTDKKGQIVKGLSKDDFELFERGKKQQISFFEFIDAGKIPQPSVNRKETARESESQTPNDGLDLNAVRHIFLFVVDDITIPFHDLAYVRQMLTNFLDNQMQPTDLVAIVRTVGGKGLLEQLTSDKELLRRAIASITPTPHPLYLFNGPNVTMLPDDLDAFLSGNDPSAGVGDVGSAIDDTNILLRSYITIGTASFNIERIKQLPGRKSLVLIAGGLPTLSAQQDSIGGNVSHFLDTLADQATRAGVVVHALDIRGLQAQAGVSSLSDTPGRSASESSNARFGREPDDSLFGYRNPVDTTQAHMGLRALTYATGGIAVLNKNDFNEGLGKIVALSEGYYLLAYTPSDNKFDGNFRKLDIKVKRDDLKVYSRRGYTAREDKPVREPTTKQGQLLAAIKSPLARRDIDFDAMLLYSATSPKLGAIDIHFVIDATKLDFEETNGKQQSNFEVVGFVFDELAKLRGGFSETVTATLTAEQYDRVKQSGFTYSARTALPPGVFQIRLAVRDNKTGRIGTLSRYLEVPNLSKGRLAASSMLIGGVPANDTSGGESTPIAASRTVSRDQDLRYAVAVYNARLKDGKPQVRTQLVISQNGHVIFKEQQQLLAVSSSSPRVVKIGQLGMSGVKPGRYTLTVSITDTLAEKKAQTVTRSIDFVVVE